MTADDEVLRWGEFVQQLDAHVPEAQAVVREHFEDYGELLLHLLMADLLRLATELFNSGEFEVEQRLLTFVDMALRRGDEAVENAVQASFVEHVGAFPEETPGFIATWPAGLRAEQERQESLQEQRD
jgi:hypothetical protein